MFEFRETRIIKSEVVKVGPKRASLMLEQNIDNRKLRPHIVAAYARQMRNGLWRENGESLLITKNGKILNGQHRLHAIVASGVTLKLLFVTVDAVDGRGELTPMSLVQDRGSIRSHTDISGISVFADKVAASLLRDFVPNGDKLARDTTLRTRMYESFSNEIDRIKDKCGTAARYYSKSCIQAVMVLRLAQGYDHTDYYRSILTDLVGLPMAWMSWYKKMALIKGGSKAERAEIISCTWALTDPTRDLTKKIYVGNQNANIEEAKTQLKKYLSNRKEWIDM